MTARLKIIYDWVPIVAEEANTQELVELNVSGTFTKYTAVKQARTKSTEKGMIARILIEGANDPRYIEDWAKKKSSGPTFQ
jgi:hypothetical protein